MRKIGILTFAAIVLLLFLKGFSALLSSNFSLSGIVTAGICLLPVFFIFCIRAQKWWLGILIGGTVWQFYIPFPFIKSFEIGIIMTVIITFLIVIQTTQQKQLWITAINSWQSKIMFIVAAWIFMRVIIDRPESIHVGGAGGAKEAYTFLLGGVVFFLPKFLFDMKPDMRITRRLVARLAIGALVFHVGDMFVIHGSEGIIHFFVRSAWFLCAYVLASVAEYSWRYGYNNIRSNLIIGATLLLGALSAHRSRFFFATGIVFIVSYLYGRLSRNMMLLFTVGMLVSMLLFVSGADLPTPVARSLSTIFPSHATKATEYIQIHKLSDEVGWVSPFRKVLLDMAGRNIRQHPFRGKGFTFSINDYWVAYYKRNTMEGIYQTLASTGAYHNSLIELAVAYGVPVVFLFCLVYIGVLIPFIKQLKLSEDADVRILFAGILGLFVAESGQLLMNGGAQDFYVISLLMGVMHYSKPLFKPPTVENIEAINCNNNITDNYK